MTQIMDFSIISVCKLTGLREYLMHNKDESCFFVNGSSLLKMMLLRPGSACLFPNYHREGLRTKLSEVMSGKSPQPYKVAGEKMSWKLSKISEPSQV